MRFSMLAKNREIRLSRFSTFAKNREIRPLPFFFLPKREKHIFVFMPLERRKEIKITFTFTMTVGGAIEAKQASRIVVHVLDIP